MSVAVDRTARGVVIFHGIAGAFLGAVPGAILSLILERPSSSPWFRDVLIYGALGGALIGVFSCLAGILHEDLRSLRRKLQATNASDPHMETALPPAPARFGATAERQAAPGVLRGEVMEKDEILVGVNSPGPS
jgi:hypothetical protein